MINHSNNRLSHEEQTFIRTMLLAKEHVIFYMPDEETARAFCALATTLGARWHGGSPLTDPAQYYENICFNISDTGATGHSEASFYDSDEDYTNVRKYRLKPFN